MFNNPQWRWITCPHLQYLPGSRPGGLVGQGPGEGRSAASSCREEVQVARETTKTERRQRLRGSRSRKTGGGEVQAVREATEADSDGSEADCRSYTTEEGTHRGRTRSTREQEKGSGGKRGGTSKGRQAEEHIYEVTERRSRSRTGANHKGL